MRLHAVRSGLGRVIDFIWDHASDSAAVLMRSRADALHGKRLCAWQDRSPLDQPALVEHYRRILESGRAQSFDHVHWVDGRQEMVIHRVICEGDSIAVTLINLSANRRAQARRLQIESSRNATQE